MEKIKAWSVVVVVALVVGLVGFFIGKNTSSSLDTSGVKTSANSFVNDLVKGNVDGTYSRGSTNYQAKNTKDYVKTVSDSLKSKNPIIKDEQIFFGTGETKNEALYLNTVENLPRTDVNSTKGSFVIRLIKEGDSWKVDSSQVY